MAAKNPGDFTGHQKAKLAQQHAEEQQKRAGEMAMITAEQSRKGSREVIDYTNVKQPAPAPDPGPVDYTEGAAAPEDDSDPTIDAIVAQTHDDDDPHEMPQAPRPAAAQPVQPTIVKRDSVLIRARYDLENVTIGQGNHYNFEAETRYRVPANVAEHLAERSLVDILQ